MRRRSAKSWEGERAGRFRGMHVDFSRVERAAVDIDFLAENAEGRWARTRPCEAALA